MLISCADKNKISGVAFIEKEEIEPNNSLEYSQYIDLSSSINGSFYNESDADFYCISPTNGFIMDFFISVYDIKANVSLDIFSSNDMLFSINTKDIENYKGFIELKDILFKYDSYFLKAVSDKECRYNLRFVFKDNYLPLNETEPNNFFVSANNINSPNDSVYGYFIKNFSDIDIIDEKIKPYIKDSSLIDIDIYKIRNDTDINTSINIKLEYSKNIDMILFDGSLNYIKESVNELSTSFNSGNEYYIALICYGEKYILERYKLYYEFNLQNY